MAVSGFPEIIVTGVTTLDEARYFSAMGVDWIGFNADRISPDEINAITEWIVGPRFFGEIDTISDELLTEVTQKTGLQGICVRAGDQVPPWYTGVIILRADAQAREIPVVQDRIVMLHADTPVKVENAPRQFPGAKAIWYEIDMAWGAAYPSGEITTCDGIVIRSAGTTDASSYDAYDRFFDTIANPE